MLPCIANQKHAVGYGETPQDSLRDSDAADQILESPVGAQAIEYRFNFEIGHQIIAFLEAPLKPLERTLLITNAHAHLCH
jgi:hypothetical protein